MVALLIAARLSQHVLTTSSADPSARLPILFRKLPGIERLNVTSARAAELLDSSEQMLAQLSIPYILSVHESYLADAIRMLKEDGKDPRSGSWVIPWSAGAESIDLAEKHLYIQERTGVQLPARELELFEVLRLIRNRIVHYAGAAGPKLPTAYRHMSVAAKQRWRRLAGRNLTIESNSDRISLLEGELKLALSVPYTLGIAVNEALGLSLSRGYWASLVVADYLDEHPNRRSDPQLTRRIGGYARREYGRLGLTEAEVGQVIKNSKGGSSH